MSDQQRRLLQIAGGVVLLGAVIGAALYFLSGDDEADAPSVPITPAVGGLLGEPPAAGNSDPRRAKVIAVLRDTISSAHGLMTEKEQRQATFMKSGMTEADAEHAAVSVVQERFALLDKAIQTKHSVTQEQITEWQDLFRDDPEVAAVIREMKILILGKEQVEMSEHLSSLVPSDMTLEAFSSLFEAHLAKQEATLRAIFDEAAKDTKGKSGEEKDQYFQLVMEGPEKKQALMNIDGLGISQETFECCLMKYGNRVPLVRLMEASQMRQMELHKQYLSSP